MSPSAGSRPGASQLVDLDELIAAYHRPPSGPVAFGTSGHRGTSLKGTFTEAHVKAISEAIARHRKAEGITGPLFVARDTHALSEPAFHTAISVFSAHGLDVRVDADGGYTPTPALSHAILTHPGSDGIVLTPSHNPPEDGGYKYNPPSGGPAGTDITKQIERIANELLEAEVETADPQTTPHDYVSAYVDDLPNVIDIDAIREANVHIGVEPLGGASVAYFKAIAERHQLNLEVVNEEVDPTFRFVPLDHDGKIRMDCSSPYVMSGLIEYRDRFDVAVACDPDADRHGIVTPTSGLMNPNHYLAVAIHYLFGGARDWGQDVGIGKTLVSSTMIDLVARELGRTLVEVPVGFKWFVDGLIDGTLGFGGEESAGASFLRRDGTPWSTDKDGLLLALLAAEITATTGKDPGQHYTELTERHGAPAYKRVDSPIDAERKEKLLALNPEDISATELAGDPIAAKLTRAPGNDAPIGGVKVVTESGWFAARPSGTEDIYKLYAESLKGEDHLQQIIEEARGILG
ncbi:phosphoglucomutase (alpha-D-glucose-1,6-bisphosphate-dependent) [Solirubrobacter deserti]|uniref:Phosphoglucomutase (Alpha-D-glucose-1,6-bisphosphate-dependent) n=1 Tax=Solirubrobacter deserti TaxID=2282478 RepID=A0ABT4RE01_9ACTN|nr:phosphoglucomutase (alpha-D-glucose-1,6-bisphosphate-dependent) [Solirubrobacter deserti]MDA0136555.1 phosphoglucomutase (alpha-D-glucose-1,6-bisphosphate-dependent) [Solirubrobacter deserti]